MTAAPPPNDDELAERAVALAESLIAAAHRLETPAQRRRARRLARLLDDPRGKALLLGLTDRVVRVRSARRAAAALVDVVHTTGGAAALGPVDRVLIRAGTALAPVLPSVVMPLVGGRLRRETGKVLVAAEPHAFARHAARRRREGVHLNVNVLGEAILGEEEAARRLKAVLDWMARPDVDHVSVKISAVCSQLSSLAFDHSVERIATRLRALYTAAARHRPPTLVTLDMEEYRDLELTLAAFMKVLAEPAFTQLDAGIVLQAYLPDAYEAACSLAAFAEARRARGGGRVKVRIVKGANLAMERVDAELHGWPQAPYPTKAEVDASYKVVLDELLDERWADCLRIGVATHNVFDAAWALVLADARHATDRVELETLEGVADAATAALVERAGRVLVYAPLVRADDFDSAIAYLVRRLDENAGPENYLRHSLSAAPGSLPLRRERDRFLAAVRARHDVTTAPRRTQDRGREGPAGDADEPFTNEPDTDLALPANRRWVEHHLRAPWPDEVVPVVDGVEQHDHHLARVTSVDPGAPAAPLYRFATAGTSLVDRAVAGARRAQPAWAALGWEGRRRVLRGVAAAMAAGRGEAVAAMARDAGKTVPEGDPEVSEAVDFARYYAAATRTLEEVEARGVTFRPHGVVVVASPWNFPYSIPAGGVLSALAAGNAAILKPAPETVLTASLVARHCWEGGVPPGVLQLVPCADDDAGRHLVTHDGVDAVVLTGSWDTAQLFRGWKPELRLLAETSGKNALVITETADLDAAVRDLVRSAFGHAGQKCSAASLAIVEAGLHDDPRFFRQLRDAVTSLEVGAGWDLRTTVGPVIRPPEGNLARALHHLEPGERWLVEPAQVGPNPHPWTPGVRVGVRAGSWFHLNECFGPVLGVLRADDLDHAIALQNAVPFGLTGGIHALDEREVAHWLERVEVGNAYVNRHITGAIVQRQPFGGWKQSSVGATFKAGGPNTLLAMGRWTDGRPRPAAAAWAEALERAWAEHFGRAHDATGLRAERNELCYRSFRRGILLRGTPPDVELASMAARRAGTPVLTSLLDEEGDDAFAARVATAGVDRLRVLGPVPVAVHRAVVAAGITVDDAPFVADPRVELARWLREQAVSETRHRYGNLLPERTG